MPLKGVLQSRWLKGLNGAFGIFSQPPNSVPKISNLLLTRLGSFETTPGSRIVSSFQNQGIAPWFPVDSGMWKELFYYNPSDHPERAGYFALREEPGFPHLQGSVGTPQGGAVAITGAIGYPGTLFAVTAADGVGGESRLSPSVGIVTGSGHGIQLTWNFVANAYAYNVYMFDGNFWRRLIPYNAPNTFNPVTVLNPVTATPPATLTFTFGSSGNFTTALPAPTITTRESSTVPPATDTTQTLNLLYIPVDGTGWNYNVTTNLIYVFPADLLPNPGGAGSGQRGGGLSRSGGGGPAGTISGGIPGIISPIPQIIQFADKMILALGNGITPFTSVGFGFKNTVPITNSFQATFPNWQPQIGYIVGDQIVPAGTNNTLFTAVQGGISGALTDYPPAPNNHPNWPTTIDVTVADGQVIWKNSGSVATPPPPAGAAHAEVYAGSLWLANTRPAFNQKNPSDGPSAIWMSDANNPGSWNPLNTAQIARDDGTEIMGLKAFSIAEAGIPTTQQLVVFKNYTTYVINGVFGASDFSIQQAETDQGCIAPRSIQFIPGFGLIRLTHLGFSYFDGIRDTLVSTDIHPWLFGDINQVEEHPVSPPIDWAFAYFSKGAQVADPPMYICAVPVLGANSDLLGTIPASQFTIVSSSVPPPPGPANFPVGQYYFRISLRSPIMETAVSPEIGPITVPPSGSGPASVTVFSSQPLPAGYTGWRIYWGSNGPGSESHYQDTGPELNNPLGTPVVLFYPGLPTTGPPIGLSGTLTRIFCYDLTLKCWTKIELPFSISVLKHFRIMGEPPVVFAGGFWDNTIRRLFSNAPDWDGTAIYWYVQSAEVYNQGGDQRVFYRRVRVRGSGEGPIYITPSYDGAKNSFTLPAVFRALGSNQFMAEEGMMEEAVNCNVLIEGLNQVRIDSIDFHAVPKPVGAGVVIS